MQVATFMPAEVGFELLNAMMMLVLRTGGRRPERALQIPEWPGGSRTALRDPDRALRHAPHPPRASQLPHRLRSGFQ
jgi:hypothetical protein